MKEIFCLYLNKIFLFSDAYFLQSHQSSKTIANMTNCSAMDTVKTMFLQQKMIPKVVKKFLLVVVVK